MVREPDGPIGEHLSGAVDEPEDAGTDCCWTERDGHEWWRIDAVRGRAYTYCYAVKVWVAP